MADYTENSIEMRNVVYEVESILPIDRLNELRHVLANFQEDWSGLFIDIYPLELQKLAKEFSEFSFYVTDTNCISTIFCMIKRKEN